MPRPPDGVPRGAALLELLRAAVVPLTIGDLRAAGIQRPANAVYELQLDGHRVVRTGDGLTLFEGERRVAPPQDPPPRVRVRPRQQD
ncbi:MAG TPA: hypothetical protein VFB41_00480 [Solirubrobacteraceae bacterium]|nr:hypothetical protein [Solirubrobacteraceae bacterium]